MKKILLIPFFIGIYVVPFTAHSDTAFFGSGFYKQITAQAEYDSNAKYFNLAFEYDEGLNDRYFPFVNLGTFAHFGDRTNFLAGGYAARTRGFGWYVQGNAGLTYLDKISSRHATQEQFFLAIFGGYKTEDYNIRLGWEHISNGSEFIGSPKPNDAEDMITISIGVPFSSLW